MSKVKCANPYCARSFPKVISGYGRRKRYCDGDCWLYNKECPDCGAIISRYSKKCQSCAAKDSWKTRPDSRANKARAKLGKGG